MPLYSPYSILFLASNKAAVGTILTSSVMTRCLAEIRTHHLPDDERMRNVLNQGRGYSYLIMDVGRIYGDIMTGENCRQFSMQFALAFICRAVYPVGGEGREMGD